MKAVQHLTLWISNIMAVKSAMIIQKRDTQASLKDYKRATGVGESKGSIDYFLHKVRLAKNKELSFKFLYVPNFERELESEK
jgi:hypothetical protein